MVFTGRYYAEAGVNNAERVNFAQGDVNKATADELRAAWGPVFSTAGTFTITGNTMKWTRTVAKNPAAMASGNFMEFTFTLNGDNLTMTQVRNQAGPVVNPPTVRLTRAK